MSVTKKGTPSRVQQYLALQHRLRNEIVHRSSLDRATMDREPAVEIARYYLNEQARSYETVTQELLQLQRKYAIPMQTGIENGDRQESSISQPTPEGDVVIEVPLGDLSMNKKTPSLRGIASGASVATGELTNATPEPSVIWRAPAARLNDLLQTLFTEQAYERYILPPLTDMWHAHYRALDAGDIAGMRIAFVRGLWFVCWSVGPAILRTLVKWMGWRAG